MPEKPTYEELEKRIKELEQSKSKHMLAHEKCRENETLFRSVMEQSPLAIEIYDPNGKLLIVNDAWEPFWDMKKSDVVEFNIFNDPECERTGLTSAFKKVLQDTACSIPPSKYDPKESGFPEGSIRWISSKMYPIKNIDGKIKNIVLIMEDITALKVAEEALQNAHNELELKVEGRTKKLYNELQERKTLEKKLKFSAEKFERWKASSPIGILQSNARGGINDINDTILKMLGYSRQDLLDGNLDWTKLTPPEFLHLDMKAMEEASDKGFWTPFEKEYLHKDGHRVPIIIGGSVFKEYADEYIVFVIDITAIKEAETSLRESEEKYRMLFKNMAQGVFYQSADGKVVDFNQNALDMFGLNEDQFLGRTSFDPEWKVIHEDGSNFPGDQHPSMVALRTGKPVLNVTAGIFNTHRQDFVWLNINAIPQFKNGDSKPYQVFVTLHDITNLRKTEEELRQAHKMESIGTLAGGVAHDFNNLLYMIVGNTELALEDIPKWNPVHESLEEIKTASLRAAGIVKQLLNFSRKTNQNLKPMGAVAIIKDAMKFIRATLPSTIEINMKLPDVDVPILGDPTQMNQLMMNICTNASQAMEETGGTIEVKLEILIIDEKSANNYPKLSVGNHIKISVSDTGPGITPNILDRIFDPYFTTREFGESSGMGLTIVHGIVKNHNGVITVKSELGEGTTFNILFPVIDEEPKIEIGKPDELPTGTESILFIDDEKILVNLAGKTLERLGYKVRKSLNPIEALEIFQSSPNSFDLVITDMTMPQMTGAQLSKKLKKVRFDIPIIICTGHSAVIDEEKARQLGIDGFLMKPVSMSKISKAIREVLDK